MGDTSQGTVLRGQVQGVKRGVGVTISPNGAISVDPTTITGVVKTNNTSAFNDYIWPNANGTANQVLTTSDDGTLRWDDVSDDFFKNVFTAKGQLIVGTGVKTYTLQNVGVTTAFLVADSSTASGLIYTNNSNSSVLLPVGTSAQRDCYCDPLETALTGQFRYSTTFDTLEFYNGVKWIQVAASDVIIETFVKQTVPLTGTASAVIIGGTSAQRQNAPLAGYFRYNTDEDVPEFYDGTVWNTFIHSILPGTTGLTFTGVPTPEAGIVQVGGTLALGNGGTGATTQPAAANNILPPQSGNQGEYLASDGTNANWQPITDSLVAGEGIDITSGPGAGDATISFQGGRAIYFAPIYLVPGESITWSDPGGIGPQSGSLGPYEINYPAGATKATMQTRTKVNVNAEPMADYSGTGFLYVVNPKVTIQITGEALPGTGTFIEELDGVVGGYITSKIRPAGAFLLRTDEVELTNPAGGTFFITLIFSQLNSGGNSVTFGFPQFYIQPYVNT